MDKKREKKTIDDTVCRVHRSGGYAVLSNCFVRSVRIGCDSIALLGKIMDLPPTWNFTIAGLVAICKDGETAVRSQLAELEEWGYAKKVLQKPNENPTGKFRYVYDFYEYSEKDDSSSRLIPNANCPYSRSLSVMLSTPTEKKLLRLLKRRHLQSNMPIRP